MTEARAARLTTLNPDAPSASSEAPETAETGSGVGRRDGVAISKPAETISEADRRWHWKRTSSGGWYSGPGMPDAHCDTCGGPCRDESDLEDA